MAEVFLAVQNGVEGFEKRLAIKRIRPHLSGEEAFLKMFLNEARIAAQLQHPNIVQIYDLGRIAESYFIAMEYIQGRDMSRVVPKAEKLGIQFPVEYAVQIASMVLDGLFYAHTKADAQGQPLNIVHRDVTPENIMVAWNGSVKILDFGIAKAASQTDQTKAGEIKGKLSYMSPEQAMGKALDARSDIFSMGIVLYEWITGYRLFTGENEMAILKAIIDGKIYPPSYFREDIPEDVERILMRALEKDRDQRYQSARDMQLDILEWMAHAEFAPSAAHLANFMKQIFADEIAAEQRALASQAAQARKTPPPPPMPGEGSAPVQVGEAVGRAKTPGDGQQAAKPALIVVDGPELPSALPATSPQSTLNLILDSADMARLEAAAQRAGVPIDEVIRDLIRGALKYL
ncbi:MAG: serine/threonine protein kinase [Deltaproteobacteria bacterium]|nr:serine/threonine protein kinase [Deltaproteobacteria bacterium]